MAYRKIRGIPGLVYEPEPDQAGSKHKCRDCYCCQWCSDSRCGPCLKGKKNRHQIKAK